MPNILDGGLDEEINTCEILNQKYIHNFTKQLIAATSKIALAASVCICNNDKKEHIYFQEYNIYRDAKIQCKRAKNKPLCLSNSGKSAQ